MKKTLKVISFLLAAGIVLAVGPFPLNQVYAEDTDDQVDNGIPVVTLNIDETQGSIDDMNESPDHSVYCYGTVTVDVPEGFRYSDYPDIDPNGLENAQMSIRGRGNSTWRHDKKPYKIKLDSKSEVLGLAKNKHWVLIANVADPTLMLDRITGWLGDQMGFPFTPRGVPVDVVMTGQEFGTRYLGSYYLSENVRVDTNHLEIAELKEDDTDPETITGGYLLQNASQLRAGSPDRFFTDRGVEWGTDTPSFDTEAESLSSLLAEAEGKGEEAMEVELGDAYKNPAQQEYIQNYVQKVEDILFDGTTAYRDYIDVESSAKYWLVNTVSRNQDAFATGSTYLYKDRDSSGDSKFYWGPLWDFDFAWTYNFNTEGLDAGHKWLYPMFYDKDEGNIRDVIKEEWKKVRVSLLELIEEGGVIDQYYEETKASALSDHRVQFPDEEFDYSEKVEELKDWIRDRIAWLDENLDSIDGLVHRVTYLVDDEVYRYDFLTEDGWVTEKEPVPVKEGYTFLGWTDEKGDPVGESRSVKEDMVLTARFVPDESMTHGEDIAFSKASDMVKFGPFYRVYQIPYEIIPTDAEDRAIKWTSSDVNMATVDNNGRVIYNYPGTVTFTGELRLGKTRQFTLTIINMDDDYPVPASIFPEEKEITMQAGDQSPFVIATDPSPAKIDSYEYESDDPNVASVGEYGVITAVGPGRTKIRVRASATSAEGEEVFFETEIDVTVTGPEPDPEPEPDGKAAEYRNTEGGGAVWNKGSGKEIRFVFKRSEDDGTTFGHFKGIRVDGAPVDEEDYTAESGSVVITLKSTFLETLEAGAHTLAASFDDGEDAFADFTVLASADDEEEDGEDGGQSDDGKPSPRTGDESRAALPALLWIALAGLALILAGRRAIRK